MKKRYLFWKKLRYGILIFTLISLIAIIQPASAEESGSEEIILNFTFPEPEISEVNNSNYTYHKVTMNGTSNLNFLGVPILPIKPYKILLQQKGLLELINISYGGNTSLGEGYNVTLGTECINFSGQQNLSNESNFNLSKPYPLEIYGDINTVDFRGYTILAFNLYPVHYLGETGEIYYYENMTVKIKTNSSGSINPLFRKYEQDEISMKKLVDDYTMNSTYDSPYNSTSNSSTVKAVQSYDYVIITTENLKNPSKPWWYPGTWYTFQDLANYKNNHGTKTTIVTVEEIKNDPYFWDITNSRFNDTQAQIRNFIDDAEKNWGIQYVLLGGDVDKVPVRLLYPAHYEGGETVASDLYYSCLDGNYNKDNDDKWGEPFDGAPSGDLHEPPGPPSEGQLIGYELLDGGKVLHIWNTFDSYYFNTSNGLQFTNHKDNFWSTNVLMLGYYNNDVWNLIYRTDELSGFTKNVTSDNKTYVNVTLWKNLNYQGYDFRLAIRYYLGVDDNELTVIPYIKNIDDEDIPYVLGFGWELKDIQVDMTASGDYIEIDRDRYNLNGTIDNTYTDLDDPCYYIRENITSNTFESLYLRWSEDLNYKLKVESRDGQYNAPVTLGIKIGTLNIGQEKYTYLYWYDASEITFYFDNYSKGEEWVTTPEKLVDGSISNYASTGMAGDVELCDNNTCTGDNLGTISKVEIRAYGYYTFNQRDMYLRPVFNGNTDGSNNTFVSTSSAGWSRWFDITNDGYRPNYPYVWTWSEIRDLDCDIEVENDFGFFTLYCSKVEIRVTFTPPPPDIYNPYPVNGSNGISINPSLNITVSNSDGDLMNITWLSNSSGSWQVFGTNTSVSNGTYHQTFSNATENGQWWYWKVNVSDEDGYNVSDVFKFYTGYQSKIVNTGSTNISGYLLIQVQYYNTTTSNWILANDTINETMIRTINSSEQFGLDTVFNGFVNTSNLLDSFGSGTYRVYAAFRDPDGDVLVCDDETLLETTYEFTISAS